MSEIRSPFRGVATPTRVPRTANSPARDRGTFGGVKVGATTPAGEVPTGALTDVQKSLSVLHAKVDRLMIIFENLVAAGERHEREMRRGESLDVNRSPDPSREG